VAGDGIRHVLGPLVGMKFWSCVPGTALVPPLWKCGSIVALYLKISFRLLHWWRHLALKMRVVPVALGISCWGRCISASRCAHFRHRRKLVPVIHQSRTVAFLLPLGRLTHRSLPGVRFSELRSAISFRQTTI
jgi:hypothetical protein